MLRAYARRLRNVVRAVAGHTRFPPSSLLHEAFRGFVPGRGGKALLFASLSAESARVVGEFDRFAAGGPSRELARTLVEAATHIDDGTTWHEDLGLRSYVDASLQAKAVRALIEIVSAMSAESVAMEPLELVTLVLEDYPNHRPALLVHAELLLDVGTDEAIDDAIASIERALRVDSVCPTAQRLLLRARRMKRGAEADANEDDLAGKFCHMPFTHFSTGFRGDVFPCLCPAWLPFSIGNIFEAESFEAIWNSERAQEIRRSILDGDYSYCSRTLCSFLAAKKLPSRQAIEDDALQHKMATRTTYVEEPPEFVELNHDPTCNLACPSCRTGIVIAKPEEQQAFARAADRVLIPLLRRVRGQVYVNGGGEAFASEHLRSILKAVNRTDFPGLSIRLITNGTSLTPTRWAEYSNLPEMIDIVQVSLDAARPETFENLRRPARWSIVSKNLEHLAAMRREGTIKTFGINFVVQKANFREIFEFVDLGLRLGADCIWFQRLTSYGSYDPATFAELDVTSPGHPDHAELLEILRHPVMQRKEIHKLMLDPLLPESAGPAPYLLHSKRAQPDDGNALRQ